MKVDGLSSYSSAYETLQSDKGDALRRAQDSKDPEALKKAAQGFESYFIKLLLKSMRSGIQATDRSHQREMYEDMFDDTLSKTISEGRGIGVSDMIYKSMMKRMQVEQPPSGESDESYDTPSGSKME